MLSFFILLPVRPSFCTQSPRKGRLEQFNTVGKPHVGCRTSLLPAQGQGHHVAHSRGSIHIDSTLGCVPLYGMFRSCAACGPAHHAPLLQGHLSKVPGASKSLAAKELGRLQLGNRLISHLQRMRNTFPGIDPGRTFSFSC